jgi:hypothetical protein
MRKLFTFMKGTFAFMKRRRGLPASGVGNINVNEEKMVIRGGAYYAP